MAKKHKISVGRGVVSYEPSTGAMLWDSHETRPTIVGSEAGTVRSTGHRFINNECASRLAFTAAKGPIPRGASVRYKNGDPGDLTLKNLVLKTRN